MTEAAHADAGKYSANSPRNSITVTRRELVGCLGMLMTVNEQRSKAAYGLVNNLAGLARRGKAIKKGG